VQLGGYVYANERVTAGQSRARVKRLGQEHADLSDSLPLSLSSTVWVRYSEDRIDMLQAMISGPEGSPYSNGLFLFDVFFPDSYPSTPPKVSLQTTGQGKVRFNPNLYACGKVCLSLLGTWQGHAGENWNEYTSTFLQVLVSIQSLILVPDPYFNEPGYEVAIGTPQGSGESRAYNERIREQTVKWAMVEQLLAPNEGFEEVIRTHFRIKRLEILAQLDRWTAEGSPAHSTRMRALGDQLRTLLSAL